MLSHDICLSVSKFPHLVWWFLSTPMLLTASLFHSVLWLSGVPVVDVPPCLRFSFSGPFGGLHVLPIEIVLPWKSRCTCHFEWWFSVDLCFPDNSVGKESTCNAGDPSLISWDRKIHWRRDGLPIPVFLGFLCGLAGKESACNAGDLDLIPGLGRSPGEGKGYPLQCSGLENSMDCIVHRVAKCQTWLSDFHFIFFGPRPMSGIAGLYDTSMSCISWKLHAVFHSGFTIYIPKKIVGGFHFLHILCRSFILFIYLIFILCKSFWWWPLWPVWGDTLL